MFIYFISRFTSSKNNSITPTYTFNLQFKLINYKLTSIIWENGYSITELISVLVILARPLIVSASPGSWARTQNQTKNAVEISTTSDSLYNTVNSTV